MTRESPYLKHRGLILALLLLGAVAAYFVGFALGFAVLIGLGMVLELGFWVGLIRAWRLRGS